MTTPHAPSLIALAVLLAHAPLQAQALQPQPPETQLPDVVVHGNYNNAVGTSDAASEGVVTAKLIQNRPTLRPAEILEFVPGVIVSQHSGDGKANQYYLRGFNLDHGTDFATWVDGMPVNMVTHAHGQGYSDLNFLIPELVRSMHYRKGPYSAEDGDFASAGSARMQLLDQLPKGLAALTVGGHDYARALVAHSTALPAGHLLYAVEAAHNNGPWDNAQHHRRFNGWLRYSLPDGDTRQTFTAMTYASRWDATNQVPQRAIDQGLIGRFGAIDPTDGGRTARSSLSWTGTRMTDDGEWQASAYLIASRLNLWSNVTYFLDNPTEGDQIEQSERRRVVGGTLSRLWRGPLGGHESTSTLGLQWRHDRLSPVALHDTVARERRGLVQESRVRETGLGIYAQNDTRWTPWLRSVAGMRADHVGVKVRSSIGENSGSRSDWIATPKLSLIFGPWSQTEYFVNLGHGLHSNDARGMTARVKARDGEAAEPSVPLVRTRGAEVGLRTEVIPGLQSSLSLWHLSVGSELIFVGDAAETEASGASRRLGIEFNNHYVARPWLLLDADVAVSQARFRETQGDDPHAGRQVPGSVRTVVSLGATVTEQGPWFGQFQLRYFGPRPLIEDNSIRSKGTTLAYARVGYRLTPDVRLSLDVFNLFDRKVSDIDYHYTSRLPGEADEGVDGLHSHPAEPRTLRLSLQASF